MEVAVNEYLISTDKSRLSVEAILGLLRQTYWANERSAAVIEKSIAHSICFGIYHETGQVGFSRLVTDYATMYWGADVIIDKAHRGKGLGKALVRSMLETEEIQGMKGILMTEDAHGLYEQFGFVRVPNHGMIRRV
ncbi:MAG: GNAT family N-acetyltransferase [Solirubrobacterales bacterium]